MDERSIVVITHAGYRGDEYPTAFIKEGERIDVAVIIDRWIEQGMENGEMRRCFKVFGSDGHGYLLLHNESTGAWSLR